MESFDEFTKRSMEERKFIWAKNRMSRTLEQHNNELPGQVYQAPHANLRSYPFLKTLRTQVHFYICAHIYLDQQNYSPTY